MASTAQTSLLSRIEPALLARSARFHTHMQLPQRQYPVLLLPARRRCASQANTHPEISPSALQQESQKPSTAGQMVNFNKDYWDPFSISPRSLRQMMSAMDKLFGEIPMSSMNSAYMGAPWDVIEDESGYHIHIDLPGFEKDEVKVHVDEGTLVVNAQRKKESGDDQQKKWSTRTRGSYYTKCALPKNVKADEVVAKLSNGVLEIHLPRDKREAHLIDVKVE